MADHAGGEDHAFLFGHCSYKDYVGFMTSQPIDAASQDIGRLNTEWRAAQRRIQNLQRSEKGLADNPPIVPFQAEMRPLIDQVLADPVFTKCFSFVPAELGLLELDRLVACQTLASVVQVQRLKERLGPSPSPEQVFRVCMPFDHPMVPTRLARTSDHSWSFVSESNDLRFLEAVVLRPDQVVGHQSYGPVAWVVGLVVGYGSNYLNVIAAEGRMVLNNGNHRAYALRALGVTHVPCVIQRVESRDELKVVAATHLRRNPDAYLTSRRPPLVKDYFDPELCRIVRLGTTRREVRVSYNTEEMNIP
jgi:hypothetical protein